MIVDLHAWSDVALLLLRIGLAGVFLTHGLQKWALWNVQPSERMPAGQLRTLRLLSIAEPAGAIAVVIGLLTQLAALGFVLVMLGAIRLKATQMRKGFSGEGGWELDFVLLIMALAVIILGPGRFSVEYALLRS